MTTLLTAPQKLKLRSDGHKSRFYLSVSQPVTLLTATIDNAAITRGAVAIAFDGGTSADVSRIKAGQTLTVTLASGKKYSTTVVSFTSSGASPNLTGTITVDANAIAWENNAGLVSYENYEPRAIPPTFDANTGISKKRGQVFSDQTTQTPPVALAGPHRAGFLSGGTLVFDLAGSGRAMAAGATISSYSWASTIGTIAAPASQNTTLTCDTAGQGWLSLTVTDSNGKSHTTYRRVFVHDSNPDSADYPYADFICQGAGPSWDGGGQASFQVHGAADLATFADGALVVLWQRAWYGADEEPISLVAGGEGILFAGYIDGDTIDQNWQAGTVSFKAGTILAVAKNLPMQGLSIHAENAPAYWFQYDHRMTIARALHWLWYWHSTLFEAADVFLPTNTLYKKLFKFNEGSLYSQAADLAGKILANIACNAAGQVYIEEDIQLLSTAGRAAVDILTELTPADWRENLTILRRHQRVIAAVKLTGYVFDGQALTPYCSIAPARIRDESGSGIATYDGMVIASQADANRMTGRLLAQVNNDVAEVRIRLAGNYSGLDVVPQHFLTMDLAAGDTPRGITWTDAKLIPRQINHAIDQVAGTLFTDIVCEVEALGPDGITDPCPIVPDAVAVTPPWPTPDAALPALFAFSSVNIRDDGAADWTEQASGSAGHGVLDRWWTIKQGSTNPQQAIVWWVNGAKIYRSEDGGLTSADVTPAEAPPNTWDDDPAPAVDSLTFVQIFSDAWNQDRFIALAEWQNNLGYWRGWLAVTDSDGAAWEWLPLWDESALPDQTRPIWLTANGSYILVTVVEDNPADIMRLLAFDAATLAVSAAYSLGGATLADVASKSLVAYPRTVLDDDDLWYVFGRMSDPAGLSGIKHVIKTANAGAAWSSVESGWGSDYCAGLDIGLLSGGNRAAKLLRYTGEAASPASISSAAVSYNDVAELSASLAIVAYVIDSTGELRAALVDISTNPPTVLDDVQVEAAGTNEWVSIVKGDATNALISYMATGWLFSRILYVTGGDTLNVGTNAASGASGATNVSVDILSSTLAIAVLQSVTTVYGLPITIDLSAHTVSHNTLTSVDTNGISPNVCKADASSALLTYNDNTTGTAQVRVLDAITSGGFTTGSEVEVDANTAWDAGQINPRSMDYISDGKALMVYQVTLSAPPGSAFLIRAVVISVSGSTPTVGTPDTIGTLTNGEYEEFPVVAVTGANTAVAVYDHAETPEKIKRCALAISGTSVTAGGITLINGDYSWYKGADGTRPAISYRDHADSDKCKVIAL